MKERENNSQCDRQTVLQAVFCPRISLVDVSNVVRNYTGSDAKETPTLVNGLDALCRALSQRRSRIELYGDIGLWSQTSRQRDTVEALCRRFGDWRSMRLWRGHYGQCAIQCVGQNADRAILHRAQDLINRGATPEDVAIISNDRFLAYTGEFDFLCNQWLHDGPDYLCPFKIEAWKISVPRLALQAHVWRF